MLQRFISSERENRLIFNAPAGGEVQPPRDPLEKFEKDNTKTIVDEHDHVKNITIITEKKIVEADKAVEQAVGRMPENSVGVLSSQGQNATADAAAKVEDLLTVNKSIPKVDTKTVAPPLLTPQLKAQANLKKPQTAQDRLNNLPTTDLTPAQAKAQAGLKNPTSPQDRINDLPPALTPNQKKAQENLQKPRSALVEKVTPSAAPAVSPAASSDAKPAAQTADASKLGPTPAGEKPDTSTVPDIKSMTDIKTILPEVAKSSEKPKEVTIPLRSAGDKPADIAGATPAVGPDGKPLEKGVDYSKMNNKELQDTVAAAANNLLSGNSAERSKAFGALFSALIIMATRHLTGYKEPENSKADPKASADKAPAATTAPAEAPKDLRTRLGKEMEEGKVDAPGLIGKKQGQLQLENAKVDKDLKKYDERAKEIDDANGADNEAIRQFELKKTEKNGAEVAAIDTDIARLRENVTRRETDKKNDMTGREQLLKRREGANKKLNDDIAELQKMIEEAKKIVGVLPENKKVAEALQKTSAPLAELGVPKIIADYVSGLASGVVADVASEGMRAALEAMAKPLGKAAPPLDRPAGILNFVKDYVLAKLGAK